jgi:ABC-2 type transport system ATP-binding protein
MLLDIIPPDSGEILLDGRPIGADERAGIGYLPEERGLYRKERVLDILVYFGMLKGLDRRTSRERSLEWLARVGLADTAGRRADSLSKGMQQKVQIAGTLLHDPAIVVMDEPFSGLDPSNTVVMKDVLLEAKKAGKTILFSTHRMDTVERLCDSICLIDHGKAMLTGELREVKSRYGRNNVQLEYEGQDGFLNDAELVQSFNNYGKYVEVRMKPGADAQKLLHKAAATCRINKFELMEPSLEEIFIDVVGKSEVPEGTHRANA